MLVSWKNRHLHARTVGCLYDFEVCVCVCVMSFQGDLANGGTRIL